MDNEELRLWGHRVVDWMADYLGSVETLPVRSQAGPGQIREQLSVAPPLKGEPMEAILADLDRVVMPGMTHWQHPSFFAYFPANSSPPSILGEMVTATLAAQCMAWETSPAAAEMEERMADWLRQMLGLPDGFVGSIQDTASTATLVALLVARERATDFGGNERGPEVVQGLTVYASTEAHSSVGKAVAIAGIGRRQLRQLPVDDRRSMRPDALANALAEDRARGLSPAFVVACLGTTSTGAMDDLGAIGALCREHDVWLHVDAAWAGSALICPELRGLSEGIEHADSFVFNPHKWLFTNFDCSLLYVRDPAELTRTLTAAPEYLKTRRDEVVNNYRDWGIQLGRRFRALKLWFVIRSYGVDCLRRRLREHVAWARELAGQVAAAPGFELVTPPSLSLFCFRFAPPDRAPEELDGLNEQLLHNLNDSGRLYLTHTRVDGRFVLRFVVGQARTERRHVQAAWQAIEETAAALA